MADSAQPHAECPAQPLRTLLLLPLSLPLVPPLALHLQKNSITTPMDGLERCMSLRVPSLPQQHHHLFNQATQRTFSLQGGLVEVDPSTLDGDRPTVRLSHITLRQQQQMKRRYPLVSAAGPCSDTSWHASATMAKMIFRWSVLLYGIQAVLATARLLCGRLRFKRQGCSLKTRHPR